MILLLFLICKIILNAASAQESQPVEVILTFDDFPMGSSLIFEKVQRAQIFKEKLDKLDIQAVFFCIGEHMDSEEGTLSLQCVGEDHFLANHTYTHFHLSEASISQLEAEIDKTESILSSFPHHKKWFRFPYLDYGDRTSLGGSDTKRVQAFLLLRKKGYHHAYITINTFDWYIDSLLKKGIKEGKSIDWHALRSAYLSLLEDWMDAYHERWSRVLKKKFAHVLLLHANDINALFLEEIVDMIQRKGWRIIAPDEAFNNPIPYLSYFANTKIRLFNGVSLLSKSSIDDVLENSKVFSDRVDAIEQTINE